MISSSIKLQNKNVKNNKRFLNGVDVLPFNKMEIKILDDKKNKLMVEIKGVDHTLCNAIKREMWNDNQVKVATYSINHPQIGVPKMIVETDGKVSPRNALLSAVQRLQKNNAKFKKNFTKEAR